MAFADLEDVLIPKIKAASRRQWTKEMGLKMRAMRGLIAVTVTGKFMFDEFALFFSEVPSAELLSIQRQPVQATLKTRVDSRARFSSCYAAVGRGRSHIRP